MTDIKKFQEVIGYHFHDEKLLRQALTHSSFANEKHLKKHSDNERLEFLGDAVLEIISSEFLYQAQPNNAEFRSTHYYPNAPLSSSQREFSNSHYHF